MDENVRSFFEWIKLRETSSVITESDEIVSGFVRYTNDWDMERCAVPHRYNLLNPHYSPNGDGEWVYQFSRFEFLHKLIIAYYISNKDEYLKKYNEIVKSFYHNNYPTFFNKNGDNSFFYKASQRIGRIVRHYIFRLPNKYSTYRTLDTAIRCYSLLLDNCYLKQSDSLRYRINKDLNYVENNLRAFDETSNWGIIIISLLLVCRLMLNDTEKCKTLEKHLIKMLLTQISSDGMHCENSTMYHTQILICLLRLIRWSSIRGYIVEETVYDIAKKMVKVVYDLSDPNEKQIQYGDSDRTNLSTVLFIAKTVLNMETLIIRNEPDDYILLYEFPEVLQNVRTHGYAMNIPTERNVIIDGKIWAYDDSKYSIRVFNTVSPSSHAHADNGEILLYYCNKPVFIDCGRKTYLNKADRIYYRGPFAHNIAVIDNGIEWQQESMNYFGELPIIKDNKQIMIGTKVGFSVSYSFEASNVDIQRTYLVCKNGIVVVITQAACPGKHVLSTLWNLDADIIPQVIEDNYLLNEVHLSFVDSDLSKIQENMVSYHYNEEIASKRIVASTTFDNTTRQIAVISDKPVYIEKMKNRINIYDRSTQNLIDIIEFESISPA